MVECSTTDQLCLHLSSVEASGGIEAPYGASAPGLAELMGLGANALSGRFELFSALSELQQQGLVEERTAVVDTLEERRRVYRLTEAGMEYARTVRERLIEQEITVKTGGGAETLSLATAVDQFDGSLAELLANVEDDVLVIEDDIDTVSSPESQPFVDREGHLSEAREYLQRSLELKQELGARHDIATTRNNLGILAAMEGNLGDAREYVRRSLTLFEELGDSEFVAKSHGLLGLVAVSRGNLEAGRGELDDALAQLEALGAIPTAMELLRYHLEAEFEAEHTERATTLCDRAQSLVEGAETGLGYQREQVESLCDQL